MNNISTSKSFGSIPIQNNSPIVKTIQTHCYPYMSYWDKYRSKRLNTNLDQSQYNFNLKPIIKSKL